ncbi:P-loop containing nucleoside triphosphate hydrolase protein [Backusella circina FSU 941]|nr:P-loop containing nucleoside triphosphate hydrolase protein [Backusella circina FSU 941]
MSGDPYMDYLKKLSSFYGLTPGKISAQKAEELENVIKNPFSNKEYSVKYKKILKKRRRLPVYRDRQKFLDLIHSNQFVILVSETGSGKTTQIPQFLVYDKLPHLEGKMIACTQPRRVATTSVARRVAEEMDVDLGGEVGYSIRFEDKTSPDTFLKYMTDGMLFREAMFDPLLTKYSAIVLDEVHERSLNVDILMALLKNVCKERSDLNVVIMSATLDTKKFQKYFDNAPVLDIVGRTFPVDIVYSDIPVTDYVQAAVRTTLKIHLEEPEGDVLVFLTGEKEIEDAANMIEDEYSKSTQYQRAGPLKIIPLYSSLSPYEQQQIFEKAPPPHTPGGKPGRKIIVSTNIAQTSVTIDGIVYVVDSGYVKQGIYNPRTRVDTLQVTPISKASAKQRSGRAGRTRAGKAYRLYTEHHYEKELLEQSYPEILKSNLSTAVLQLLKFGVKDLIRFDFMDPPSPELFVDALHLLENLHACDNDGRLTPAGDIMSFFPLDPPLSRMLIESPKYGCSEEILSLAALLSVPPVFIRPYKKRLLADRAKLQFASPYGDHLTLLRVYDAYKENLDDPTWCRDNFVSYASLKLADDIRIQLRRSMEIQNIPIVQCSDNLQVYHVQVRKAICEGFFLQVARLQGSGYYQIVKDLQNVRIHPSSTISFKNKPSVLLYNEITMSKRNYIRTCTAIQSEWLYEIGLKYYVRNSFTHLLK